MWKNGHICPEEYIEGRPGKKDDRKKKSEETSGYSYQRTYSFTVIRKVVGKQTKCFRCLMMRPIQVHLLSLVDTGRILLVLELRFLMAMVSCGISEDQSHISPAALCFFLTGKMSGESCEMHCLQFSARFTSCVLH